MPFKGLLFLGLLWFVKCELFLVKSNGKAGYLDSSRKFIPIQAKTKITQILGVKDGIYALNQKYYVYKLNKETSKWKPLRKRFISITSLSTSLIGLTADSKVFGCKYPCDIETYKPKKTNDEDNIGPKDEFWGKFRAPPLTIIKGTEAEEKVGIRPKVDGKLIHINSDNNILCGVDELGQIWCVVNEYFWHRLSFKDDSIKFKWIWIYDSHLYVILTTGEIRKCLIEKDITKNDVECNSIDNINGNDFNQISIDKNDGLIYVLNYYKQLFYYDEKSKDMIYIDDDISMIYAGDMIETNKQEL